MIEVNLLPGGRRGSSPISDSGGWSLKLPTRPKLDRLTGLAAAAWIVSPLLIGWLLMDAHRREAQLELAVQRAARDSVRYARLVQVNQAMQARRDTIARKLQIIQEADAGRYVWPHILDELSRCLPAHVWLTGVSQIQPGVLPAFRIEGNAGSTFLLTRYMAALESSPFIRAVHMTSTELVRTEERRAYRFVLEASYERPPPGRIETVPFFAQRDQSEEAVRPE